MKKILNIYMPIFIIFSFLIILLNNRNHIINNTTITVSNISNNKYAYLTFDDGPSENTKPILEILDKYELQATFFVVGPKYKLKDDLLREIVNHGHKLAIHSYTHKYSSIYSDTSTYLKDFSLCLDWIKNETNITPTIYRFPGGSSTTIANEKTIKEIINLLYEKGYNHIDWNVDSFDSHYNDDVDAIISTTINQIKVNETNKIYNQVILMHDNKNKVATIKALPFIIERLLAKGYTFKTLDNTTLIQHKKRPV